MPSVRGCNLPDDLLYDVDNHIWFQEEGDGYIGAIDGQRRNQEHDAKREQQAPPLLPSRARKQRAARAVPARVTPGADLPGILDIQARQRAGNGKLAVCCLNEGLERRHVHVALEGVWLGGNESVRRRN